MHQKFPRNSNKKEIMAATVNFKIEESRENQWRRGRATTHPYNLRKCSGRVATPAKVARRSKVKRGVCGELNVSSTRRKRITIRSEAIPPVAKCWLLCPEASSLSLP